MRIVVAPLHEVDEAVARWRASHVVSLASPGAETATVNEPTAWLRLTFHDIAEARPELSPPVASDVARLLAFAGEWAAQGTAPLLIQCWAGVSRSTAAAYVVACALEGEGREVDAAQRLREVAPFATPNPLIVALADAQLARDGRMVEAITGIGRGAETSMGRTFVLPVLGAAS